MGFSISIHGPLTGSLKNQGTTETPPQGKAPAIPRTSNLMFRSCVRRSLKSANKPSLFLFHHVIASLPQPIIISAELHPHSWSNETELLTADRPMSNPSDYIVSSDPRKSQATLTFASAAQIAKATSQGRTVSPGQPKPSLQISSPTHRKLSPSSPTNTTLSAHPKPEKPAPSESCNIKTISNRVSLLLKVGCPRDLGFAASISISALGLFSTQSFESIEWTTPSPFPTFARTAVTGLSVITGGYEGIAPRELAAGIEPE